MSDAPADKDWNIKFSTIFPLQDIQSLNEIEQRLSMDSEFKEKLVRICIITKEKVTLKLFIYH